MALRIRFWAQLCETSPWTTSDLPAEHCFGHGINFSGYLNLALNFFSCINFLIFQCSYLDMRILSSSLKIMATKKLGLLFCGCSPLHRTCRIVCIYIHAFCTINQLVIRIHLSDQSQLRVAAQTLPCIFAAGLQECIAYFRESQSSWTKVSRFCQGNVPCIPAGKLSRNQKCWKVQMCSVLCFFFREKIRNTYPKNLSCVVSVVSNFWLFERCLCALF